MQVSVHQSERIDAPFVLAPLKKILVIFKGENCSALSK